MTQLPRVFIIGTSAGGVLALHKLIENLSSDILAPIVVVQHLPDLNHVDVATIYNGGAQRTILEVEDKMPVESQHVYFAPGGYHLLIGKDECFSLNQDEPIRYSRPSIDVAFESASQVFGSRLVGVVLTGANADGAEGLVHIKRAGGLTVVQQPEEAEFPEMPTAAIELQKPDFIVKLTELPELMLRLQGTILR